ncbi:MAG: TlpA family protein disulfide reductase [Hyphomonadaceae bacterium]
MAAPAFAQSWRLPAALEAHTAYASWARDARGGALPMDAPVLDENGRSTSLSGWLGGRPAVVAIWATWCAPCLVESPDLARLSTRLEQAGARTIVRAVQAYDTAGLHMARATLQRIRARDLKSGRAMPAAERAFIRVFGASPNDPRRIPLPCVLLIGPDGRELGRGVGVLDSHEGRTTYWGDAATFDFLRQL